MDYKDWDWLFGGQQRVNVAESSESVVLVLAFNNNTIVENPDDVNKWNKDLLYAFLFLNLYISATYYPGNLKFLNILNPYSEGFKRC